MQASLNFLERHSRANAEKMQNSAMHNINGAILEMMKSKNSFPMMGMPGMSMDQMLQQMQGLSAEQMAINQLTMQIFSRQRPGGGYSMSDRAQVDRLKHSQEKVRQSLEQLANQFGDKPQVTGDLQNLENSAKKIAKKFERKQVDRDLLRDQDKFLGRLLDASKSIRKRGTSRKRHSKTGKEYDYSGRSSLAEDPRIIRMLREELLRALREQYPLEYKELIREYFESLIREGQGEPETP
jgi:hypothetical protein